jgi:drug/metabolite transporter (DMT)-like permease
MSGSVRNRFSSAWLFLVLANVLWATSYVASKFVLHDLSVTMMLALRMSLSALLLLPFLIWHYRTTGLSRKDLLQLALLSLLGFVVNKLLEFGGLALSTASDVALLISAEALYTATLSWLLLREPFKRGTAFSLLLGFCGVYLVVGQGILPTFSAANGGVGRMIGDILVMLALLCEAFYTVRGKSMLVKQSPLVVTAAAIVGSMAVWGPVAGWEVLQAGWPQLDLMSWLAIGWLVVVSTIVAYLAWFYGLSKVDGSLAASTLFIQPLLGTLLAIVLLNEHLTSFTIVGGLLIIVSVYALSKQG